MSRALVQMRVNTIGAKFGDVVEVDAEQAAYLVANGHALAVPAPVKPAKAAKSDKD